MQNERGGITMKRSSRVLSVVGVVLMISLYVVFPADAKVSVKLGHIRAEASPTHLAALKFAEVVANKTSGEVEVKVYPNSQLGGALDMFTGMKTGAVDMVYGGINTMGWIKGAEVFQITAVPFLFHSYEDMKRTLSSPLFKPLAEEAEKATGIKIITMNGDTSPRQLTTKDKPVNNAADFKGLKIRIAESAMVRAAMTKLGANPTVIPFSDLYMALRQGVVDAQENGVIPVKNMSFFEVQKYLMLTNYIRDIETFYISPARWNGLSGGHQKVFSDAAEEAGVYGTELTVKAEDEALKFLSTKMTVIKPDLASIRNALEGVYEEQFEGKLWPKGLLKDVRAMQK
jgi:tripartite ATP-independent transporter DctP family solute receptor